MKIVFECSSNTCSISLLTEGDEKCLEYVLSAVLLIFVFL